MQHPITILEKYWNFTEFKPLQEDIINSVLDGDDTFALLPTGGGKSLCFQIPALAQEGICIVISPLIALMKDQVQNLQELGIKAMALTSGISQDELGTLLDNCVFGNYKFLYLSPERLQQEMVQLRIREMNVNLIAVDEAHCISQWGNDFRPAYKNIAFLRQLQPAVNMIALTASATPKVVEDIIKELDFIKPNVFKQSFARPNIAYLVLHEEDKYYRVESILKKYTGSSIIYVRNRKLTVEISQFLESKNITATYYHGGLSTNEKNAHMHQWLHNQKQVMIATNAFGMGIDKPNVRFVVHYDLPKNIEGYYQETGRAGRDGLASEALLLFGMQDVATAKHFVENVTDEEQRRLENFKLSSMVDFAEAQTCRRNVLLNYFSEPSHKPCGNCDICLDPPTLFDGKEAAQKALSCIYRLEQSFGAKQVIDVLRGMDNERIRNLNHNQLSTYGVGKEYSAQEWSSILRQLIHLGYIYQDIQNYSVLKLTALSGDVLKGKTEIQLAFPKKSASKVTRPGKKSSSKETLLDKDRDCFEELRALRKEIAESEDKPAYQIFGDATLVEMAQKRPTTDNELLAISGVGEKKLENYGFEFLAALRAM